MESGGGHELAVRSLSGHVGGHVSATLEMRSARVKPARDTCPEPPCLVSRLILARWDRLYSRLLEFWVDWDRGLGLYLSPPWAGLVRADPTGP